MSNPNQPRDYHGRWTENGGGEASHKNVPEPHGEPVKEASPFEKAKAIKERLEKEYATTGAALKKFPRGPTGLTPDAIKASPEWKAARAANDKAFSQLRSFNAKFFKAFPRGKPK